jgi:hypothetical protein
MKTEISKTARPWWLTPVILATQKVKIGRILVPGQPKQKKFSRPHLNRKSWVWWHAPVIATTAGSINRRTVVQVGQDKKERPYLKNNQSIKD